jgi:hypothetical protein
MDPSLQQREMGIQADGIAAGAMDTDTHIRNAAVREAGLACSVMVCLLGMVAAVFLIRNVGRPPAAHPRIAQQVRYIMKV